MLTDIFSAMVGLIGILLLSYGAYIYTPAAGYIVLGFALTAFSFLLSRASAFNKHLKTKGK
jgi:hypothetical protein